MEASVRQAVAEWEQRSDADAVVVAVPDVHALAVDDLLILPRPVVVGRVVTEVAWEGDRQLAGRIDVAEQHVGQRVAGLLALIPGLDDGGHFGGPGHGDGGSGLVDDHGARVGAHDGGDQRVLAAVLRQVHGLAVVTLGLPLSVEADHHDGDGRSRGRSNRLAEQIARLPLAESDAAAAVLVAAPVGLELAARADLVGALDEHVDGDAGVEEDVGQHVGRAVEHGLALLRPVPVVDQQLPGDEHAAGPDAHEGEGVRAAGGRRQRAPRLERVSWQHALGRVVPQEQVRAAAVLDVRRSALEPVPVEVLERRAALAAGAAAVRLR